MFHLLSNLSPSATHYLRVISTSVFDLLYPVEFTCLSNINSLSVENKELLYPVEFTCLSNLLQMHPHHTPLLYPVEFTCLSNLIVFGILMILLLCNLEFSCLLNTTVNLTIQLPVILYNKMWQQSIPDKSDAYKTLLEPC